MAKLLPTTVVGSYPQPSWLVDRELLATVVPRTQRNDLWRVDAELLREAQDDATRLAIADMEQAGIDIITDGEVRRESYSNLFATSLDGVDGRNPAIVVSPSGTETAVPRVVGRVQRVAPVEVQALKFLKANTERLTKVTLPGPFTMALQAQNDHYSDDEELLMDLAAAVNQEAKDLAAAGADVIQLDEPWVRLNPELAERWAVQAIDAALDGVATATAVHVCFGYAAVVGSRGGRPKPSGYAFLGALSECVADQISIEAAQPDLDLAVLRELSGKTIMLGVLNLALDAEVETAEVVAARIRDGLRFVRPENLMPAPDCGMKYLSRARAKAQLTALADGAALVRAEL